MSKPLLTEHWYLFSEVKPKKVGFYWIKAFPFPSPETEADLCERPLIKYVGTHHILDDAPIVDPDVEDQFIWLGPIKVPPLGAKQAARLARKQAAQFIAGYHKECTDCSSTWPVNKRSMVYYNKEDSEDCKACNAKRSVFVMKKMNTGG